MVLCTRWTMQLLVQLHIFVSSTKNHLCRRDNAAVAITTTDLLNKNVAIESQIIFKMDQYGNGEEIVLWLLNLPFKIKLRNCSQMINIGKEGAKVSFLFVWVQMKMV